MAERQREREPSGLIFERLIRGEATSAEYVTALRAEAREAIAALLALPRGERG